MDEMDEMDEMGQFQMSMRQFLEWIIFEEDEAYLLRWELPKNQKLVQMDPND